MSQQSGEIPQLNIFDKVILGGDQDSAEVVLQRAGFLVVTIPTMACVGYGTYYGLHNTVFSSHEQYDTAQTTISSAEFTLSTLGSSIKILRQNGIEVGDESSVIKTQEARIAQAEKSLPENYDPSVDGLTSLGLGVVAAGAAFAFTINRFLKADQKRTRINKAQTQ